MSAVTTPASLEQRLLWYLDHYRGGGVLNCPVIVRTDGPLDREALARALDQLVERHESLHTTFADKGRRLTRVVEPPRPVDVIDVDLRGTADAESAAQQALATDVHTRIDPTIAPLRVTCWRLTDTAHVVCVNMHHLAADGWSCGIVFQDLLRLYARACGAEADATPVAWQYSDYVRWQQEQTASDAHGVSRAYWLDQLDGARVPPLPLLSGDRTVAPIARRQTITIDADVWATLQRMARQRRTTLFTVMLSLYYAMVHALTGETDLAVTSLFANRLRPELGHTVGAFSTMLVLRTRLTPRAIFSDLLRETHATVRGAFLYQAVPFQTVPGLELRRESFRADDVVFHMTGDRLGDVRAGALDVRALPIDGVGNRFALELALLPKGDTLTAVLSYDARRIDSVWASGFVDAYAKAATAAATRPEARLDALLH